MRTLLLLLVFYFPLSARPAPLQAGAAVVDITPKQWPLGLVGSFHPRLADAVHDPLNVRSLVLSDGAVTLSLSVVDNCLIKREVLDEAKALAAKQTGIPVERMMVSATHTHSAPSGHATAESSEASRAYRAQLIAGIAASIVQAHTGLTPAEAGWGGRDLPGEVFNRRWFLKPGSMPPNPFGEIDTVKMNPGRGPQLIAPAGPTDPEVSILSVRDARGKPLCLLGNYPLHYVGGVPQGKVSADYFGEFARLIGSRLRRPPETGFVGILSNGTSGDINNINFFNGRAPREPFEQIRLVAAGVSDAAWWIYKETKHHRELKLDMRERRVTLQVRKPSEDRIAKSKAILDMDEAALKKQPRLARAYAERLLKLAEGPDTIEMKIQAIRIGDLSICTLPFEVFAEIGLELKSESPFDDTFIIELANGAFGYLPTKEQHVFGGYETWLGTSKVQLDASEILVEQLLEMLGEMKP